MRKTINSKLSENSKLSDFLKKYRNESLVFFVVFVVVFSSMKMLTGSGSNGNVEHWINLTNQMFYGKQDFLFSYGPLFWLTAGGATTQYNTPLLKKVVYNLSISPDTRVAIQHAPTLRFA